MNYWWYSFFWTGYLRAMAQLMSVYILEYKWDMAYTALEHDCNCTVLYNISLETPMSKSNVKTTKSVYTKEAMIRIDI
jgi:hypothetical protein